MTTTSNQQDVHGSATLPGGDIAAVMRPRPLPEVPRAPATRQGSATSSRELGLDIALILARYLCGTNHLHYGYWEPDLPCQLSNLKAAQERYTDFLVSHIPEGVRTILEVGIGSGALAHRLIGAGYQVDCVSPSPYLTERARALLGPEIQIFECKYEDLETPNRYDLILFSESFQYVKLERAISVSLDHLRPDGYLLISDFFRKEAAEDGPIKGGHRLLEFQRLVASTPLRMVTDNDISAETAPNLDLLNDFCTKVIVPIKERLFEFLSIRHPLPYRALHWLLRKQIRYAEGKYLSGCRNGAAFLTYKSYRLMVLRNGGQA